MINDNENIKKIDLNYLEKINENSSLIFFGDWTKNIKELKKQFKEAKPFEHIVINNFLEDTYAETLYKLFPQDYSMWHKYDNPLEVKSTFDNIELLPEELKNYFYYLSSNEIINVISEITDIKMLEYDEYLHGAGLHSHTKYGRLNIHLDYEKHPFSGKERKINIILFISKNWNPEWNGANELWNKDVTKCISKTNVVFNSAIIFKTNDISWHGVPEKIMCPENIFRNSLAYYYVSQLDTHKNENEYRKKAKFIKHPNEVYDPRMEKLYEIRSTRRITNEDINSIIPEWKVHL
jgi:Rps23 Pro-64 3,4-dihydroxylase Tpa1-like proline 4-hydroxylase